MIKEAHSVTLDGEDYQVVIPTDFAAQRELVVGMEANTMRGASSLIGLLIPRLGYAHLYGPCNCNSLIFGGRVWEGLVRKGINEAEIPTVGLELYKILKPIAYPGEAEVSLKVGNS